ncbi:glycosyltransferase family 2 protein [Rhodovarius lipocyclicus]|uniref:glycosyltransferase family 2 protein n=1 Tax=Rhodovarius lipocyclicus TaxID=268410 RepID=UPI00135C5ED6|nr:glycosyltransferase [Rhodovarius lipocyclicus]
MEPKVSVIVPVYNVETYLEKCLDTISAQTLRDIEIIVVNDGATDRSREVALRKAREDSRIRLIDQENQGLGFARNTALDVATGKYVVFVDSDDWLDHGCLEAFYAEGERTNADIIIGAYYGAYSNGRRILINDLDPALKYIDTPFHWRDAREVLLMPTPVWDKMYRRDLIERNHIRFVKETSEDIPFKWQVLPAAQRISVVNAPFYYYRVRGNSLTSGLKVAVDVFRAHDLARRSLQRAGLYDEVYPEWTVREINEIIYVSDKARPALLANNLVFSAYYNLASKVFRALDLSRLGSAITYIPREYLFRVLHIRELDSPEAFRRLLQREANEFQGDERGLSLSLGKKRLHVRLSPQDSSTAEAKDKTGVTAIHEAVTAVDCVPERYAHAPEWPAAAITYNTPTLLPPIHDDGTEPAEVRMTMRAPWAAKACTCIAEAFQPEREVAIKARIRVIRPSDASILAETVVEFPVGQRIALMAATFPEIKKGEEFILSLSALRGAPGPAYYTAMWFHSFHIE